MSISPSLKDLYDIANNYEQLDDYEKTLLDKDNMNVIYTYIYNVNTPALDSLLKTQTNNNIILQETYWLGGQIKMNINEPITQDILKKIDNIIKNTDMSCCWGAEIYSVMEDNNRFEQFKKFYKSYEELMEHRKYKPLSDGYRTALESFNKLAN